MAVVSNPNAEGTEPTDFRIGRVLKRTCLVYGSDFLTLTGIATLVLAPGYVVRTPGYAPVDIGLSSGATLAVLAASLIFGQCMICFAAFQVMGGRLIRLAEALKVGLRRFLPVLVLAFFFYLIAAVLGALLDSFFTFGAAEIYVDAVLFTAAFLIGSVTMPACVAEGLGPIRSLRRSWALTKGNRGKMLVLIILAIAGGLGLLMTTRLIVRVIVAIGPPGIVGPVGRISAIAWIALWLAFYVVLVAASCHELRAAKGGSEPDQLAAVFE